MAEELNTEEPEIEESGNRKLAAIMFTDIKDFSKKMATNETAAMELLKKHDAMMRVFVAKHGGKVIKSIGDSFMVDFPSVVNAVKCATKVQEHFWKQNKGKTEYDKIEVRIGIHLGDVIISGEDMYGDGVNIAARIEALTEPNRICISNDVFQQVKNKMTLNVYHMGSIELKNIPEPIEIYEVLIDSISELSQPSETAKKAPSRKKAETITKEEEDEARAIEKVKKKAGTEEKLSQDDKLKMIQGHYKKAEEYFEKGEYEKAEEQLNEIYKLDPNQSDMEHRLVQEEEKQEKVDDHYRKAERFFEQGLLANAEKEISEIFKVVPMHQRAQELAGRIEDKRYQSEEAKRRKKDAERRVTEEKEEQIENNVRRAKQFYDQFKFSEALEAVQQALAFAPDHAEAKELETLIQQRVKAPPPQEETVKPEVEVKEVKKVERRRDSAQLAREAAERAAAEAAAQEAAEAAERARRRAAMIKAAVRIGTRVAAVVGVVALLYYGVPMVYRALFPNTASIAVVPFNSGTDEKDWTRLGTVIASLVAQDFTGYNHVTVVAPSTSTRYRSNPDEVQKIARELNVRQIILGDVRTSGGTLDLSVYLFDADKNERLWSRQFSKEIASLPEIRSDIVRGVLGKLDIDVTPRTVQPLTSSTQAYELYLQGLGLIGLNNRSDVDQGMRLLQAAVDTDQTFSSAYAALARGALQQFKINWESDKSLISQAVDYSETALKYNKSSALAYLSLGTAERFLNRFDDARKHVQESLSLQPSSSDCQRELACLSIVEGKYDNALEHVAAAKIHDPKNYELSLVEGLIHHFKKEYADAIRSYETAIDLGGRQQFITSRYLTLAWNASGNEKKSIEFHQDQLKAAPNDYTISYKIGRCYQLLAQEKDYTKYLEGGKRLASQAADANPRDPRAHAYLALFLSRLGDISGEWEREVKTTYDLSPSDPEVLYRMAAAYAIHKDKKKSEALAALKKAVELDYDFSEILNTDFLLLSNEPEFVPAITRKIKQAETEQ